MTRRFLTRCYSSDEDFNADCDYAEVTLDRSLAKQILARRKAFLALKKVDRSALETYYWNGMASYLRYSDDSPLTSDQTTRLGDGSVLRIPIKQDLKMEAQPMECDQMIITEDGVRWTAIPKHTGLYITTASIPYEDVEKVAKG